MNKILLLLSVLMLPILLSAQDDDIDLPFDNEPLSNDSPTYFVLAGGITYDWLMIDEEKLNLFTPNELTMQAPLQLIGGQGVIGVPWVKNLRIGMFGYGGSVESQQFDYPVKSTIIDTTYLGSIQSNLTASMFGFSFHYGYVPFAHFAILGGVNLGWGDVTYERFASSKTFDDVTAIGGFGTDKYEKNYFFVMPNIQLEYAITSYIILRADASYNLTVGQDSKWTHNTIGTSTVNPDFNLNGMKVGFGVMVGLANF